MTFGEHLEELRQRLIRSLLAVLGALLVTLFYMDTLVKVVVDGPHARAQELVAREHEGPPGTSATRFELISGTYQAPFLAYIKLCFIVSLFLASPFIGYQMWKFIGAGLYDHERRAVLVFAPVSILLFLIGCAFGYFILIPYALYFFVKVSDPGTVRPVFTISEYLDLVILLTLLLGAVFQLPLVMLFFAKVGLASHRSYLKAWRAATVGIFVFAALATPPDPISQLMMAGPLMALYFLGILLSRLALARGKAAPGRSRT